MQKHLIILVALLLSACVNIAKVGPGEVVVKDQITAKLDSAWNRVDLPNAGKNEYWTTDGLALDTLVFYPGVTEGTPLDLLPNRQEKQQPIFKGNMTAHEIVDLYSAVVSEGGNRFSLGKLSPAEFVGGAGFRFEFTLLRKNDEVELKGIGYGAIRNGKLYLMAYRAPKVHYYNKHLARVEALAQTMKVKG
jgi:hypothetical protein